MRREGESVERRGGTEEECRGGEEGNTEGRKEKKKEALRGIEEGTGLSCLGLIVCLFICLVYVFVPRFLSLPSCLLFASWK